jgi:O-antigen ligase
MKNRMVVNVFIAGIILSSLMIFPLGLDITLVPRFFVLAVCLAVIFCYFSVKKFNFRVKPNMIYFAYAGYVFVTCISIFWSNTHSEAFFDASKQVVLFLTFLLTCFSLKHDENYFTTIILKFSIVLSVVLFLVAGYQLSTLQNFTRESFYEVSGINGHKNLFSSFLFLNLFFLIRAFYRLDGAWKMMSFVCVVFTGLLLFLLKTKAVWAGSAVAIIVSALLFYYGRYFRTPKKLFVQLVVATLLVTNVFFLILLQPIIQKSIHYTSQGSKGLESSLNQEEERLILWDKTYQLFRERPLFGVGAGNWQINLPDATLSGLWRGEELNYTYQRPHNDLLWILSETGIVGFNLFLLFIVLIFFSLARTLPVARENSSHFRDGILCCGFVVGYFTISFFDFPRERAEHGIWISMILGTAFHQIRTLRPLPTFGEVRLGKPQLLSILVVVTLIVFITLMRLKGEFFARWVLNYRNSGEFSKVIDAGRSASSFAYSIDPTSVPLQWYTGNAHASLGHYGEALADFKKAYKFAPYNRNVLNDLASACVFTNDVRLAKKYYKEAARISPRFDDPKLNLASLYINAKDFKTAEYWIHSLMHDSERRSNYQKIVDLSK